MSSLFDRMREAAKTLEEAGARANADRKAFPDNVSPFVRSWNAGGLEGWADKWEAEAKAKAEYDTVADRIACHLYKQYHSGAWANVLEGDRLPWLGRADAFLKRFDVKVKPL